MGRPSQLEFGTTNARITIHAHIAVAAHIASSVQFTRCGTAPVTGGVSHRRPVRATRASPRAGGAQTRPRSHQRARSQAREMLANAARAQRQVSSTITSTASPNVSPSDSLIWS